MAPVDVARPDVRSRGIPATGGTRLNGRSGSAALLRSPDQLTFEHLTAPADVIQLRSDAVRGLRSQWRALHGGARLADECGEQNDAAAGD